jgi:hypothetical protein
MISSGTSFEILGWRELFHEESGALFDFYLRFGLDFMTVCSVMRSESSSSLFQQQSQVSVARLRFRRAEVTCVVPSVSATTFHIQVLQLDKDHVCCCLCGSRTAATGCARLGRPMFMITSTAELKATCVPSFGTHTLHALSTGRDWRMSMPLSLGNLGEQRISLKVLCGAFSVWKRMLKMLFLCGRTW